MSQGILELPGPVTGFLLLHLLDHILQSWHDVPLVVLDFMHDEHVLDDQLQVVLVFSVEEDIF